MVSAFENSDIDLIEVDFSCPNIPGKAQVAYNFEQVESALAQLTILGDKPIGIKLAPYFDMSHFIAMAKILTKFAVKFITCVNSIGNTSIIDPETERPMIKPKGGVGGIKNGVDAFEYLLAGAATVQIATCFEKEGASCFKRIEGELASFMLKKSYLKISDTKGKLKLLD